MESVDAKLDRAREHFNTLDSELLAFTKGLKRNLILKTSTDQSETWLVYWVDDPYPPMRLSVLIGDCVFNTRSALDNLICGLVRRDNPASRCEDTKFPIYIDRDLYLRKRDKALSGVPDDAKRAVDELQPWNRPGGSATLDPLFILNKLCNQDKHRAAHLTFGYSRNTRFRIHDATAGTVHSIQLAEPLYAGEPSTIAIPGMRGNLNGETRVQAVGSEVIAFRSDGPWRDRAVRDVLSSCLDYVSERVVKRFRQFFAPTA
jgi:hypothetical protein